MLRASATLLSIRLCRLSFPVLLALAFPAAALAEGSGVSSAPQPDCPDYGSFAVVDPGRGKRSGTVEAQSWNPCADLPGATPNVPVQLWIGVQPGQPPSGGAPPPGPTPR